MGLLEVALQVLPGHLLEGLSWGQARPGPPSAVRLVARAQGQLCTAVLLLPSASGSGQAGSAVHTQTQVTHVAIPNFLVIIESGCQTSHQMVAADSAHQTGHK